MATPFYPNLKRGATVNSPFTRYLLCPLATLLALVLVDIASRFEWFTVTLALPVGALSLCLFWSGLRANILSAVFITAYAFYSGYDTSRFLQVLITVWPVAIFGGVMRRWLIESVREAEENRWKAEQYDALNGNIERLKKSVDRLYDLIQSWPLLEETKKKQIVREVRNDLANLATAVAGWHQLYEEKRELTDDH